MDKNQKSLKHAHTHTSVKLTGRSLTIEQVVWVARGCQVEVDQEAIKQVKQARKILEESVASSEVIYGVNTGFGSNADVLLESLEAAENLQKNLILTHAVCVGEALPTEVVRAMVLIRVNTLLRGHSGIRWVLLERLIEMLNHGITPFIPEKGSVGASGDLAPLSHMALPLIGEGEVIFEGKRMPSLEALALLPSCQDLKKEERAYCLSYKEGLALINGTTLMTAFGALNLDRYAKLIDLADINGALATEAICGRSAAFREDVHALRPHPGQIETAGHLRQLLAGSTLVDINVDYVPNQQGTWLVEQEYEQTKLIGGKAKKPQDSYSIRCIPQVHGAIRDVLAQAKRVVEIELNSVTDNPLLFPDLAIEDRFASAGHFHGMPIALALSYLKVSIPSLASISERRLNKLVDPATNDGLPPFLISNKDGSESGLMIVQYTAAALVNDLASRAHPTTVYSVPTSANTEDHVSMGANEARHVYDMLNDLAQVLALELMTNTQAIELRCNILDGHCDLAKKARVQQAQEQYERMLAYPSRPSPASQRVIDLVRESVCYIDIDRALYPDIERLSSVVLKTPERIIDTAFNQE